MFLSPDQLRDLTRKQRPTAQVRVLIEMKIRHGVRPDGSIVVMESAVDAVLGPGAAAKLGRKSAPDFGAVA